MTRRHDPFSLALSQMRARAEAGIDAPGAPIVILDEARRLRLSTTPVREALGWLCGFGLVERGATGGFFLPRMEAADLADGYRFRLTCLRAAAELSKDLKTVALTDLHPAPPSVETLMDHAVRMAASPALAAAFERNASRLSPFRAAERRMFADYQTEADALVQSLGRSSGGRVDPLLVDYHRRRIDAAVSLVLTANAIRAEAAAKPEPTP